MLGLGEAETDGKGEEGIVEEVREWLERQEGREEVDAEAQQCIDERKRGERRGVPFSRIVAVVPEAGMENEDEVFRVEVDVDGSRSVEEREGILRGALGDAGHSNNRVSLV